MRQMLLTTPSTTLTRSAPAKAPFLPRNCRSMFSEYPLFSTGDSTNRSNLHRLSEFYSVAFNIEFHTNTKRFFS